MEDSVPLTLNKFRRAVTSNGFPDNNLEEKYNALRGSGQFVRRRLSGGAISSEREAAMFLAQCLHESGGLQFKEEHGHPGCYSGGANFYGRGYIQLTHDYNYKACSEDLFGDDRLHRDPGQVSRTEAGAWNSALWFWAKNVHNSSAVSSGNFDGTTSIINSIEGQQGRNNRQTIYKKVLEAFK